MEIKNYLLINVSVTPNVCENIVVWSGNVNDWKPSDGYIALEQATTPCLDWVWNDETESWQLQNTTGTGSIGYIWDGVKLTTNTPRPTLSPPIIPVTEI